MKPGEGDEQTAAEPEGGEFTAGGGSVRQAHPLEFETVLHPQAAAA